MLLCRSKRKFLDGRTYLYYEELVSALKAQIKLLTSEITELEATISRKDEEIVTLRSNLNQAQAKVEELEKKIATLQELVTSLQSDVATLTTQVSELKEDLAEAEARIVDLNTQVGLLTEQNTKLTNRLADPVRLTYWASMFTTLSLRNVKIVSQWPDEGFGLGASYVNGFYNWKMTKNKALTNMTKMWFADFITSGEKSYVTMKMRQDEQIVTTVEHYSSSEENSTSSWAVGWSSGTRDHQFIPMVRNDDGTISGYLFAAPSGNFEYQTHDENFVKDYTPKWLLGWSWV